MKALTQHAKRDKTQKSDVTLYSTLGAAIAREEIRCA